MNAGVIRITILAVAVHALVTFAARGAQTFYVDPEKGSMNNDGSAAAPWRTLAEVLGGWLGRIKGGDTILLRSGYHGEVQLSGAFNDEVVTVAAEEGHIPKLGRLRVNQCGKWVFRGLEISPSLAPAFTRGVVVSLGTRWGEQPSHELTVEDCFIYSEFDTSKWSAQDWSGRNRAGRSCSGINLEIKSTKLVARNNYIMNVATGINVAGPGSLVEGNVVRNFSIDGMRVMSDGITAQYNVIKNNMNVDDNHDDGMQAFLYNRGTGTLRKITTRANIIINRDDDSLPHQGAMQGIGYFDGPLIDFVIERNVVLVDHWHGVSLFEGQNGQVLDNVAYSRWKSRRRPWVMLGTKKGQARDNVVKNNYAHSFNLGSFAKEASNNRGVSASIFNMRQAALEREINDKFGRYHVVSGFARVTNDRAKIIPVPRVKDALAAKGARRAAPRPEAPRRKKAKPEALAEHGTKLLARVKEEVAAGRRVRFSVTAFQQRFEVLSAGEAGTLRLGSPVTEVDMDWSRLEITDRLGLARAVLREDEPEDHCLVAFYLIASGDEKAAEEHLARGGGGAVGVEASFVVAGGDTGSGRASPAEGAVEGVKERPKPVERREPNATLRSSPLRSTRARPVPPARPKPLRRGEGPRPDPAEEGPPADAARLSSPKSALAKLYQEAETAFIDGDVEGAKALFEKVVREHPGSPFAPKAKEYLDIIR